MKKIFLLSLPFAILMSCKLNPKATNTFAEDTAFKKLSEEFTSGYLAWRPNKAVFLGFHEYDGKTTDLSKASLDHELYRLKSFESKFSAFDKEALSPDNYYDLRILLSGIWKEIFEMEDRNLYRNDPIVYCEPGGAFFTSVTLDAGIYLNRNYSPLEKRLQSIIEVEKKTPSIFSAARANLADTLAQPLIENAIETAYEVVSFLSSDLKNALKDVKNDSLMTIFCTTNEIAISEFKSYALYLQEEKLPKATRIFGMGKKNFQKMVLIDELISMPVEKILQVGMTELKKEQEKFDAIAKIINPDIKPIEVFNAMQNEHPSAENLIGSTRKNADAIYKFMIDRDIVTIPSDVRVKIEEMPEYLRSASAMNDTPGPFEKVATEAYYYITPVDLRWASKQKEEWLEMFNFYTTDITTIHEAYPGHYIQFLHLKASNATKIEKIFNSYAYCEGWAHYSEQMLIEEGFGDSGDHIRSAKYRLAQSSDALLRLCRLCVSINMHCNDMTVDEATHFFRDNWYQGEKPSSREALRGTFDPRFLYYTLGKLQILKLRNDYKNQEGVNFSLKIFNDRILDHGMPPIRLLREKLLRDKNSWDEIL